MHALRRACHFVNGCISDALLQCSANRVAGAVTIYCVDIMSKDFIGTQKTELKVQINLSNRNTCYFVILKTKFLFDVSIILANYQ